MVADEVIIVVSVDVVSVDDNSKTVSVIVVEVENDRVVVVELEDVVARVMTAGDTKT